MARNLGVEANGSLPYLFISYNSDDEQRVASIVKELVKKHLNIWYDYGIEVGEKWEKDIADHIEKADMVLFFVSKRIFEKDNSYVNIEYEITKKHFNKKSCIVLLDEIKNEEVPNRYKMWWERISQEQCIEGFVIDEKIIANRIINCLDKEIFEIKKVDDTRNDKYFADIRDKNILQKDCDNQNSIVLHNPRKNIFNKKVTYDCIWFGSYPQTEIVDKAYKCGIYGQKWGDFNGYIEDEKTYNKLKDANDWDEDGNILINGIKYKRIIPENVTRFGYAEYYYKCNNYDNYHYFRYEPIKWRVFKVWNDSLLIHSDKVLDIVYFEDEPINFQDIKLESRWEESVDSQLVDGWLSDIFYRNAFNLYERGMVTRIELLHAHDVSLGRGKMFGFKTNQNKWDKARYREATTYVKAKGIYIESGGRGKGNVYWNVKNTRLKEDWPINDLSIMVTPYGGMCWKTDVEKKQDGCVVCPAISVNTSTMMYKYAGTVCTDVN